MIRLPLAPARPFQNLWRRLKRRPSKDRYNVLGICSTGHGASLALASSLYGVKALNLDRYMGKKYAILLSRDEFLDFSEGRTEIGKVNRFLLSERVLHDSIRRFPPAMVFEDGWEQFVAALLRDTPLTPADMDLVVASEAHFAVNRFQLGRRLSQYFPNAVVKTVLEHHAIHRFQAFFGSPFEEASVLTIDNRGENLLRLGGDCLAITLASAQGTGFRVLGEHRYPQSSPGLLYHWFTDFLGFRAGEEGKTMGLSSYGTDSCYRALTPHLRLFPDGSFRFLESQDLHAVLAKCGARHRLPGKPITPMDADVAFAGQMLLNQIVDNSVAALGRETSSRNLCMAGGVALNSVSNEYAFRRSRFDNLYVMPNCGDSGQALGCALYGAHVLMKDSRRAGLPSDSLGPAYSDADILAAVTAAGLTARRMTDLPDYVASLLANGRIVAWFQGGSEYGPRALGSRSILADCRPAGMKDFLNDHVKHREAFRPYAPAILEEKASEWFDLRGASPFMLRVVDVHPHKRASIAAVTHVDGTARVQTVSRSHSPLLYDLISAFEARTGVPVILNTSFNVAGRPIVETPADAVECFLATRIDALVMHDYLAEKTR